MKVLFAVQDEQVSTRIVREYQRRYKEIISYKNIYYFNAIIKELQRDKTYDRIVIDEELEEFNSNNYEQKDKFIFDKLDDISDEASNSNGEDIPIILICSERRTKSEDIFVKLFGIGIYNAIIGNDRSTEEVCKLIERPRSKKQAKIYYKIDSEEVQYKPENENDVSEEEMQNILMHFKKLGKNEEQYVESFRKIVAQYNNEQLKIVIKILPLNVRAVLEEKSPEYQRIVSTNKGMKIKKQIEAERKKGTVEKLLDTNNRQSKITEPVVVPATMKKTNVKKLEADIRPIQEEPIIEDLDELEDFDEIENIEEPERVIEEKPKRRGRPKKNPETDDTNVNTVPKKRGRPKKVIPNMEIEDNQQDEETAILPGFDNIDSDEETATELPGFEESNEKLPEEQKQTNEETLTELPGFDDEDYDEGEKTGLLGFSDDDYDEEETTGLPGFSDDDYDEEESTELPGFDNENGDLEEEPKFNNNNYNRYDSNRVQKLQQQPQQHIESRPIYEEKKEERPEIESLSNQSYSYDKEDFENLLTADKKIVTFVGTSKNGTSFIVNNVAQYLSMNGIDTAILDTTKNKNSYYIYTKNEEQLRNTASQSISKLLNGINDGIKVNTNLSVYTSVPSQEVGIENAGRILETLIKKHTVVLVDCDFDTPYEYFAKSQEIYLIQSMDILTIQPFTAFLRDLKSKDIINQNKIKILLNKAMRLRGVSSKNIIGGMAFYNDPEMSFMTELFDRNSVKYLEIPFDEEVYAMYLEGIIECEVNTNKYPKNFQLILKELANMVYPLLPNSKKIDKPKKGYEYSNGFSSSVNNTLNDMKRRY